MVEPRTIYRLLLKLYPARFREEYGGPLERQFWDDYRDAQGLRAKAWFWMRALADLGYSIPAEIAGELLQDLTYAARIYRQRFVTTSLALIALALAIGATTGVFSVVSALLLRSLPFREPERLVEMTLPSVNSLAGRQPFGEWVRQSPYLESAAAFRAFDMSLTRSSGAVRIKVAETTADFFTVLGVEPEIGRPFAPEEDIEGHDTVAVMSNALWQQAFGSDPRVLGSVIKVNGQPFKVIGVAPAGMDFPSSASLWTPTLYDIERLPKTGAFFNRHVGRLKRGIDLRQATAIYETEIRRTNSRVWRVDDPGRPRLRSLRTELAGDIRQASLVLLGAVACVLLIACANVSHLLLSRVTERQEELAVRAALGASRARLMQQMITECTLLTLMAAAGGMLVAYAAAWIANSVQPAPLATQHYTVLDWRVLGFAIGLAALTGVLFGIVPAKLLGRVQPAMDAGRASQRFGARGLRSVLVAVQAAVTLVLLAGSVTMGRSFLTILGSELGFKPANAVTFTVALTGTTHEERRDRISYYSAVLDHLRAIPGVEAAGAAQYSALAPPLMFGARFFQLSGTNREAHAITNSATPGYFAALGTPLLSGRDFEPGDRWKAIVTDEFAKGFGGPAAVLGKTLVSDLEPKRVTVVGVVKAPRYRAGAPAVSELFVPAAMNVPDNLSFIARVRGNAEAYIPICRDAIRSVDPEVPVFADATLEQRLSNSLARPRLYTSSVLFFGAFALLLAVLGVYNTAEFSIVQRTHEIGVRLAVGASHERLRASLLRQSLLPVVAGSFAGIFGAIGTGQVVRHLIAAAEPTGWVPCTLAATLLAATAIIAIRFASKRIVRLDPMRVLRAD